MIERFNGYMTESVEKEKLHFLIIYKEDTKKELLGFQELKLTMLNML